MEKEENYTEKLARAQKRVKDIKKFYQHLRIYIVVNLILFFFRLRALSFFAEKGLQDQNFFDWFDWNIIGTPVLWGIGLLWHAWYVFGLNSKSITELKPKFMKDWEERQIRKYMEED